MTKINMKITPLKCHKNLPGANELHILALASKYATYGCSLSSYQRPDNKKLCATLSCYNRFSTLLWYMATQKSHFCNKTIRLFLIKLIICIPKFMSIWSMKLGSERSGVQIKIDRYTENELHFRGRYNILVWTVLIFIQFNSSSLGQNGHHFADDIFKCIFINEKFCISIQILQKFVPNGPINNKSALVQVMTWRWTGDKPLPETMLTHFIEAYMQR